MDIAVNWGTRVISVPQAELTPVAGTIYELDSNAMRLALKELEYSEAGIAFPDTHQHNTVVTISGVTYVRFIEIINGYSVEFEDGQYTVIITGSNNNFHDVLAGILVQNQVQIIPSNTAGYIQVETGVSGLTPEEAVELSIAATESTEAAVQSTEAATQATEAATQATEAATQSTAAASSSAAAAIDAAIAAAESELSRKLSTNRAVISEDDLVVTIYDDDDIAVLFVFDITEDKRLRTPR